MALEVAWSAAALRDRRAILKFWTEHNGSSAYSLKLYKQWEAMIRVIGLNPFIGRPTDHGELHVKLAGVYNIFYQADGNTLYIVRIIDGRRDLGKLRR